MKIKKWAGMLLPGLLLCLASMASAQVAANTAQMDRMGAVAQHWKTLLGPNTNRLSSAGQNFIQLGAQSAKLKGIAASLSAAQQSQPGLSELLGQRGRILAPGKPASLPNISFTRFSGAVQSETSTAWCGKEAVVGFNDSGSYLESFFMHSGLSFEGYSVSSNSGATFTEKGFPTTGPAFTFMVGDPVLACTSPLNFLYANLYEDASVGGPSGFGFSDISLSLSSDGGNTFGFPKVAVKKDAFFHFLDKDWMTVDPANPSHVFITYTDFDGSNFGGGSPGNSCGSPGADIPRTAIEIVTTPDNGMTWSDPHVVDEVCGFPFVQGSQVIVDPISGKAYVAWEHFASDFFTREIDIASSTDGFVTVSGPFPVSGVLPVGDGDAPFGLQGFIRDFEFPSLTIGKGSHNAGTLYITWNDGDVRIHDVLVGGDHNYGFSDVLFSSSTNGGGTWSLPVKVNAPQPPATPADHFQPGVATDKTGNLEVCWYDRRRDPNNFLIDRFCGKSTNGGATWSNTKITPKNYSSVVNQDAFVAFNYQGDYDQPTSDATNAAAGFLEGFVNTQSGSQSVLVSK